MDEPWASHPSYLAMYSWVTPIQIYFYSSNENEWQKKQWIITSRNWHVIGLYHDSKIKIYDKYQIYSIYRFAKYNMLNLIFD